MIQEYTVPLVFALICWILPAIGLAGSQYPLPVVTSFSILGDITAEIGGKLIDQQVLVGPDEDAHVYQPVPSDIAAISRAKVVIVNGLHFEGWMTRLLSDLKHPPVIIVASNGIEPRRLDGEMDPHAWQSLANIRIYIRNITDGLIAALPAERAQLTRNAQRYLEAIDQLDQERAEAFASLPAERRTVLTGHDAFGYFASENNLAFMAPAGISTEAEPSAQDVARLIRQIKEQRVVAAFVENIANPRLVDQIVAETGIRFGGTLYSDALSKPGQPASRYLDMMRYNIRTISQALAEDTQP
ncbi:MAG: metal ABC transporter solute-binding protein, Zn/Mn family [Pseudomonadota bacterium]